MIITLEEMKNYLRVDHADDDALIESLISSSERLCMDVARIDDMEISVLMNTSEHGIAPVVDGRINQMLLTLRALMFGIREGEYF